MTRHKILIKLILITLLGVSALASAQNNRFINYGVDDGLAQAYVYNITQDSLGNLWIGTGNGLSRYDGYSFDNFTNIDSLGGNFITCGISLQGEMWFGHLNGTITYYNGKKFDAKKFIQNEAGSIIDLELDQSDDIWAATQNDGFVKIDKNTQLARNYIKSFPQPVYTFKFTEDNQILVGTAEGLKLCKISSDVIIELKSSFPNIPKNKIVDISHSRLVDVFYVLTDNEGLYKIKLNNGRYETTRIASKLNFSKSQKVFEDSNGNLWVSCLESGLFKLSFTKTGEIKQIVNFGENNGLQSNAIKTVFEDREGNIWIGKYGGGLSRLIASANSFQTFDEQKYNNNIHSICITNKYKWIGTDTELLQVEISTNKVIRTYDVNGKLPNEKITSLADLKNQELWIGTEKSGLYRLNYRTGRIRNQFLRLGNLEKVINSILVDDDDVWIATQKGLCQYHTQNNSKKWFTMREEGLPHNSVNHLIRDLDGRIWIGTLSNSISYIEENKLTNISLSNGNTLLNITSIVQDSEESIWVGTQGNGVYSLKNDTIFNINHQQGLLSDYCYSLNVDSNRVWVTHRGGISQIRVEDNFVKAIQKNAGIQQSVEFNKNSIGKIDNHILWFGTNNGIFEYDISKEINHGISPSVSIASLRVDGDEYYIEDGLVLAPGDYKIQLTFKGINLSEPELIQYQYMLDGYDNDWTEPELSRQAEYKQLGSGDYVFRLKAIDGNGVKSKMPLSFSITIKYPIWQKTWFQIIAVLSFGLAIYLTVVLREKNLRRIQRKLIHNLDSKTREVIAKEEVIKERKRTEKELIKAKEKAEESDRLKTAFLSNMSHEIRTPLNAIVGFSTMLQEPKINPASKGRYMSILKSNTNDLLCLIDDIMDISSIEAGQLKIKKQECNVHDLLSEMHSVHLKKMMDSKSENVQLIYHQCDLDLVISSDSLRLKQILANLISNAIKFTEKGTIEFGIDTIKNEQIKFFVRDSGIGIVEDQKEVIFERFRKEYRDDGWNKLYRGAGLGLAISKSLVEMLDGEINVESEVDKGSIFYFSIPL